ncbi:MAG TPA: hypothetical protein VJS40_04115 [Aestuariivirgaceae bacterium]|jgi:hypothetical protein|nr:hypothetical protein [Aestuariivirgaceae bacterium]
MIGISRVFFIAALGFALLGMLLGLKMAMTQDHAQMPTHAHMMVVGWLSMAVFAFFYHLFPERARTRQAQIHCWLAVVSMVVLTIALYLLFAGNPSIEPLAAISSIGLFLSMLTFAWVAWPLLNRS